MTEKNSAWREEYHFSNCVIRSDTRELLRDGIAQKIERRSFDLILYLLKLEGRVASKDELLEHVWGNHFLSESVIAQSIMKVRKALGISGKEPGPIKTIHRVGYRFASEFRKAVHTAAPLLPTLRAASPSRILWLPTDGVLDRADLSWVRYGLISVAAHVLHGLGVPTVPASEAIRWHETLIEDGGDWNHDPGLKIREIGLPTVRSRMTALDDGFRFEWRMQLDGKMHGNRLEGREPAELALRAAREAALIVRLRSGLHLVPGQEARFWADAGQLVTMAVDLDQVERALPLMAKCVDLPNCPLPIWSEFVLMMAQRADEAVPTGVAQLIRMARQCEDVAHEGWAHLGHAVYQLHRRQSAQAIECAMQGVALVRHAAPPAGRARALLLAAHVLAGAGLANEACALGREAVLLAQQVDCTTLSSQAQRLCCELDLLQIGPIASADAQIGGLAAFRTQGLTGTSSWIHAMQALQACAGGDIERCREQLHSGIEAGESSGSVAAQLFARFQLGVLQARCGDRAGLDLCADALHAAPLRPAPQNRPVGQWLRARQCFLSGDAAQALPLALAALEELGDAGLWCAEDHWLFVAQVALVAGNRRAARALLQRLQSRHQQRPLPLRQATALSVEGMLEYAEGNAGKALLLFEQACPLARGSLMANILVFGLAWLNLVDGRNPSAARLAAAGQWVEATPEGRHVRATLQSKPYWALCRRDQPVLATVGEPLGHRVTDVGTEGQARYALYLPLPV